MDWIGIPLAAAVSVIGGIVTLIIGRRIDKRHGIPNDLESKLIFEMKEYADALEKNNGRLEGEIADRAAAQERCDGELADERNARIGILRRLDDAEATIVRLRMRLGDDVP